MARRISGLGAERSPVEYGEAAASRVPEFRMSTPSALRLIAGQAPGRRSQASGVPFDGASWDRLPACLGVPRDAFRAPHRITFTLAVGCFALADHLPAHAASVAQALRDWTAGSPSRVALLHPGCLSELGRVGCSATSAAYFSPFFCPVARRWGCSSDKNRPRWGRFLSSPPQARQPPRRLRWLTQNLGFEAEPIACLEGVCGQGAALRTNSTANNCPPPHLTHPAQGPAPAVAASVFQPSDFS